MPPKASVIARARGGTAWSEVATPVLSVPRYLLSAIKVISSTNVWAVGTTISGTLVEHWNGTAWSIVPSPNPAGSSASYLLSVSATGPNDVWAVGSTSSVSGVNALSATLVEHWNGTAWSIVPSPNVAPQRSGLYVQDQLDAVVAISPTNAWASGFSNDVASGSFLPFHTVIEHWNGASWSIVASPNLFQHNTLSAIAANGANDVWTVGNGWTDQATGVPVATPELLHWTGSAWASVTPPARVGTSDNIPASVADVAGTVWVAGNAGGVGPLILRGP